MKSQNTPRVKVGAQIGQDLTVLGVIDRHDGDALCIVWHHTAWCPMACKVFRSRQEAEHEATVLSALSHPNTVRFLGLAKPANLLMEFLEGPTLEELIYKHPQKRFGTSNAIRVAIHIGAALHQVHAKGYLHLDVKPTNVIVAGGGRPVLYDFGCARLQTGARPRLITGTNPYIAPEECLQGNVTPAADVFGLAVTLYEMLTGKLPFPLGKSRNDFPQTRTEAVPIRKRRPSISAGLSNLLLTCLASDPAARPALASLLPELHEHIRTGPRMWPNGFRPDQEGLLPGKRA